MKVTTIHIKNMRIKQLCNQKVSDFASAFRVRKPFGPILEPSRNGPLARILFYNKSSVYFGNFSSENHTIPTLDKQTNLTSDCGGKKLKDR